MRLYLFLLVILSATVYAQPKPTIQLQMPNESFGGSNGSSVVWHPLQKKYVAAMAGNASFPIAFFDPKGTKLSADEQTCQYDIRGLWFHPEKQLIQGNAYDNGGWFAYSIGANYSLAGKILQAGTHQPGPQSVGTYYASNKRVGFLNGNKITFYDPNTGEVDVDRSLVLQPRYPNVDFPDDLDAGYNETTAVFTGITGKEIGILNIDDGQVELYNMKTGICSGVADIPEEVDYLYPMFNFAYTNQLFWFFDKKSRTWNGFNLDIKAPPAHQSVNKTGANPASDASKKTTTATNASTKSTKGAELYKTAMSQKAAKNYASASSTLEQALSEGYQTADTYYQLAWIYSELGNYTAAIKTLDKAQQASINDNRLLTERGYASRKLGKYPESIAAYQKAIQGNPQQASLYRDLGDVYRLSGNATAAQEQYMLCLQRDPKHYWANYEMGIAMSAKGDYQAAQTYYQKAVETEPGTYEGLLELGFVQNKLKKNDEALATLARAAAASPTKAGPHKIMGDVYRINYNPVKKEEAIQCYQKAISLEKDNVGACYGLGWLYNSNANYDKAIEVLEQALQKNRKEKNVLTEIGYSYYAKKSYMTALTFLQEATALDANNKNAWYYMGLCHCGLKDKAAAQNVYTKLAQIDAAQAEKLKTAINAL